MRNQFDIPKSVQAINCINASISNISFLFHKCWAVGKNGQKYAIFKNWLDTCQKNGNAWPKCLPHYFGGCFARFLESVLRLGRSKGRFLALENGHFCHFYYWILNSKPSFILLAREQENAKGKKLELNGSCAKMPDPLSLRYNNIFWQEVVTSNFTLYLYSAYLDVRKRNKEGPIDEKLLQPWKENHIGTLEHWKIGRLEHLNIWHSICTN